MLTVMRNLWKFLTKKKEVPFVFRREESDCSVINRWGEDEEKRKKIN